MADGQALEESLLTGQVVRKTLLFNIFPTLGRCRCLAPEIRAVQLRANCNESQFVLSERACLV